MFFKISSDSSTDNYPLPMADAFFCIPTFVSGKPTGYSDKTLQHFFPKVATELRKPKRALFRTLNQAISVPKPEA